VEWKGSAAANSPDKVVGPHSMAIFHL